MDDIEIVSLYWERDEQAIAETSQKYGAYCMKISMNILNNESDSEECVNDTYMHAWNSIPPNKPAMLSTFLGKITRNLALNCYNAKHTQKRAAGEFALSLDELDECIPHKLTVEETVDAAITGRCISTFLRKQQDIQRRVFVCRYFYCDSISEIADRFKLSESKVKSMLFRTRNKLRVYLEKEGIAL